LEELLRAWSPAGPWLAFVWQAHYTGPAEQAARVVAAWPAAGCRVASTQSLLEELLRARSPAGPWAFVWQAQYTEPSNGAAARVVAAGPRRRSTQSLLAELLRAWSPLARGWLLCGRRSTQSLLEELLGVWSPLARGWLSCGRRSTQSLLEELVRAWSPLACGWLRCWEGQYTEPPGGAAARVVAAGPRLGCRVAHAVHRASWRRCWLPLTPSLTHHLCHTPSFTHNFVTHHL